MTTLCTSSLSAVRCFSGVRSNVLTTALLRSTAIKPASTQSLHSLRSTTTTMQSLASLQIPTAACGMHNLASASASSFTHQQRLRAPIQTQTQHTTTAATGRRHLSSDSSAQSLLDALDQQAKRPQVQPHEVFPAPPLLYKSHAVRKIARARLFNIPCAPTKMTQICRLAKGLSIDEAVSQLRLSQKLKAKYVIRAILNAAVQGVNNSGMQRDRLFVSALQVGKATYTRLMDLKASGRAGLLRKYYVHLKVELQEQPTLATKLPGMRQPKTSGSAYSNGVEVRVGRAGQTHVKRQAVKDKIEAFKKEMAQPQGPLCRRTKVARVTLNYEPKEEQQTIKAKA